MASSTFRPTFPPPPGLAADPASEKSSVRALISTLNMQSHVEGGYFAETDRDPLLVPNPFLQTSPGASTDDSHTTAGAASTMKKEEEGDDDDDDSTRNASTTIFYLITEQSPLGAFHRNKARTVHTLHRGRGRYVLIHADEVRPGGKARVETFVVGQDVEKGERLQWIVEGGKYKSSFLLPDEDGDEEESGGLLISETVVPGFEFGDHDFLTEERFRELVTEEDASKLEWMVRTS